MGNKKRPQVVPCPFCNVEVNVDTPICPRCGVHLDFTHRSKPNIRVEGHKAEEVKDVTLELMKQLSDNELRDTRNPWISGSFYLAAVVIIGGLFLVIAKMAHPFVFPIVLIASLLGISVTGALQLRQDDSLTEKNFLKLMVLTFKQIPLINRSKVKETNDGKKSRTDIDS